MKLMQQYWELNVQAAQTMKEIVILTAKNQAAPRYLHEQHQDIQMAMEQIAIQIDEELSK